MTNQIASEITRVFELQRANRWNRKVSSADDRRERLNRLKSAVLANAQAVDDALVADLRRAHETPMPNEVLAVLGDIEQALAELDDWMAPTPVEPSAYFADTTQFIQHEARGVVLVFGPWNFPFALVVQPLIPIIAAGNTAIVKPNELSPATSAVVAKIIKEAFAEDEIAVFEGDVELANALLELPFDHIFFTGSPAVARTIMTAAARHLSSVTLELGGKCPAIIDGTTDLATVAAIVGGGKHYNAGQICLAPDHVWVQEDVRDEFLDHYLAWIETNLYRDGELIIEALPHIINTRNFERVTGYLTDAVDRGAKLLGSGRSDVDTLTVEPCVLLDVPADARVMQDEIFGPILPVFTFRGIDEVMAAMQGKDKPLAVYIYSDDRDLVDDVLARTSSGGVTVNGWATHCAESHLPFGGVNHSGTGSYHGIFGFRELSHARAVVIHP